MARRAFPPGAKGPPKKDYLYLQDLDDSGWYDELYRIWNELHELGHPLACEHRNILAWNEGGTRHVVHVIEPIVEIKTGWETGTIKDTGGMVNLHRLPALVVYLNASDDAIIRAVRKELLNRRDRLGKHMFKRGRHAANSAFDEAIFNKWIELKIVELADLFIWNAKEKEAGRVGRPEWRLGDSLDFSAKTTSLRKKALSEVLKSLPALMAQLGK